MRKALVSCPLIHRSLHSLLAVLTRAGPSAVPIFQNEFTLARRVTLIAYDYVCWPTAPTSVFKTHWFPKLAVVVGVRVLRHNPCDRSLAGPFLLVRFKHG